MVPVCSRTMSTYPGRYSTPKTKISHFGPHTKPHAHPPKPNYPKGKKVDEIGQLTTHGGSTYPNPPYPL